MSPALRALAEWPQVLASPTKIPLGPLNPPAPPFTPWGLRTGRNAAGRQLVVVDCDVKKGDGISAFKNLGPVDQTPTLVVETPSGGLHYYYVSDDPQDFETNTSKIAGNVDVRAQGGFIVGPGTTALLRGSDTLLTPMGDRLYRIVVDVAPAPLPEWLARTLPHVGGSRPVAVSYPCDDSREALDAALAYVARLPLAEPGERDATFFRVAVAITERYNLPPEGAQYTLAEYYKRHPPLDPGHWQKLPAKVEGARLKAAYPRGTWRVVQDAATVALALAPSPPEPPKVIHGAGTPAVEMTKSGTIKTRLALPHEILDALRYDSRWPGQWAWDVIHDAPTYIGEAPFTLQCASETAKTWGLTTDDIFQCQEWLSRSYGLRASPRDTENAIKSLATRNGYYNPLSSYLFGLKDKDLPPVDLESWAVETLGLSSRGEGEVVAKWLIAAVRRAITPGTKVDNVLILRGEQGYRKSSFMQALFGSRWVNDAFKADFGSRDAMMLLRGFWCIELAELQSLLKGQNDQAAKAFLTQSADDYREFGRSNLIRMHRSCVFCGTTNEEEIFRDPTGARRFWPVDVRRVVDAVKIALVRDAVWRAALDRADAGEPHWYMPGTEPTTMVALREQLQSSDPWETAVAEYCLLESEVLVMEILDRAIFKLSLNPLEKADNGAAGRVKRILQKFGCHERRAGGRDRRRVWAVSPEAREQMARVVARAPKDTGAGQRGAFLPPSPVSPGVPPR